MTLSLMLHFNGATRNVEIDNRKTGKVRCTKFTVVQDCGQIINPDGVRNQLQGNVVQTGQPIAHRRADLRSLDGHQPRLASDPIITFPDVPEVVTGLIDLPHEAPGGSGEPSAAIVPPAL